MQDKIELYKDILLTDPFSRIFYPLSIALKEQGNFEEAVQYLEQGLLYHTSFLEARMLFVEVLHELGNTEKRDSEIDKIMTIFKAYPSFWKICASKEQGQHDDIALALQFISQAFTNEDITFNKVLASGLQNLSPVPHKVHVEEEIDAHATPSPLPSLSEESQPESLELVEEDSSSHEEEGDMEFATADTDIHTRSMADLLAEQGELEKALEIYRELLEQENDVDVKAELKFIIQEFETRLKEDGEYSQSHIPSSTVNKENLINTLATLVSRLDARAEAIQTQV